MTIRRDDVRAAVELYLPRTANYARSEDLGEYDREAVFERILHIILTALLVDPDSVFYSVYMTTQRALGSVDDALAILDDLDSVDQLRGISDREASRIDDFSALTEAKEALINLSGAIANAVFDESKFTDFSDNIDAFLSDQVVPNVQSGGSNEKASADIRSSMESLVDAWAKVLSDRQAALNIIPDYEETDLRVKVSATIISAIRAKIEEIESQLPDLSTSEHGQRSEQLLIDLAAAKAALNIVANAATPFGTTIVGPDTDGSTDPEYLVLESTGRVEPILPILRGTDGKLYFDTTLVSTTGQTVSDGDDKTARISDASVPDFTTEVAVGQYVIIAGTGQRFTLSVVQPGYIELSGQIPYVAASPFPYFVTENVPGTLFYSPSTDFWDHYTNGQTASTVLVSGTNGSWVQHNKAEGTDGTNIKVQGTSATIRPTKVTGTNATQAYLTGGGFTDPDATFITDGVTPGDDQLFVTGPDAGSSPFGISTLYSEVYLEATPAFSIGATVDWYIEDIDAEYMIDVDEDLFDAGVVVGDVLKITSGGQQANYTIASFKSSQSTVTGTSGLSNESGVTWEVRYASDEYVSPTATFLSAGVVAGDQIVVAGHGSFFVNSVDSETKITMSGTVGVALVGNTYQVATSLATTDKFTQADAVDFETANVDAYIDGIQAILRVNGVDRDIVSRDPASPTDSLLVSSSHVIAAGPFNWSVRVGDWTDTFSDTVAQPFGNYEPGDILVYKPGTNDELRIAIAEVVSNSTVTLAGLVPQGQSSVDYAVIHTVKPGMWLFAARRQHTIVDVVNRHVLRIDPPMAMTVGQNIPFVITKRGNTPVGYRIYDPVGAATFGVAGFSTDIIGASFELMSGRQEKSIVVARRDTDTDLVYESFDVTTRMQLGERDVAYRLTKLLADTSDVFKTQNVSAPTIQSGDILTIWGLDQPYTIDSVASLGGGTYGITVDGLIPARLSSKNFVVVRGGSVSHGRYLLFNALNALLSLDEDTSALRLAVAEVLIDFGSEAFNFATGATGSISFDDDGDGLSEVFTDPSATFVTAGVAYGHRLTVTYPDTTVRTSYVDEVVSQTRLTINPPLKTDGGTLTWSIDRTSVSNALDDLNQLRTQLESLKDLFENYTLSRNPTMQNIVQLLKKHHMDRALDLLYDGSISQFVEMSSTDSSYTSKAKTDIQSVGSTTAPAADSTTGVDPSTGESYPYDNHASATQMSVVGDDEPETRVALAKAVADLSSDELTRSMLQFSLDEARNLGIYELTGEIESGVVSDDDPTLPWIAKAGSTKDKLLARCQAALDALQYMIDHPEEYNDVSS